MSPALVALSVAFSMSAETKMIVNMGSGAPSRTITLYAGQSVKCDADAGTFSFLAPYDKWNEPIKISGIESIKFTGNWSGIEVAATETSFALRNNPVGDLLEFTGNLECGSIGRIFDLSGRETVRFVWQNAPVNVSQLSSGVYILNINNTSIKIVKL